MKVISFIIFIIVIALFHITNQQTVQINVKYDINENYIVFDGHVYYPKKVEIINNRFLSINNTNTNSDTNNNTNNKTITNTKTNSDNSNLITDFISYIYINFQSLLFLISKIISLSYSISFFNYYIFNIFTRLLIN